jgi:predicted alpha/beta-fold hydrolase
LIDKNGASNSPGAQIVVTKGGGHVGFHDQALNWHIRATLAWCAGLVE